MNSYCQNTIISSLFCDYNGNYPYSWDVLKWGPGLWIRHCCYKWLGILRYRIQIYLYIIQTTSWLCTRHFIFSLRWIIEVQKTPAPICGMLPVYQCQACPVVAMDQQLTSTRECEEMIGLPMEDQFPSLLINSCSSTMLTGLFVAAPC